MSTLALETEVSPASPGVPCGVKKVLHVINGEYYAGAERVQDLLGLHLPNFGFEAGYVCVKPDRFAQCRQSRAAPLWKVPLRHPWHRSAIKTIARIVRQEGYELLHSHTPRGCWAALDAGRLTGRPVVHTIHDVSLTNAPGLARKMFNRYTIRRLAAADFVIAVSPAILRIAEQYALGADRGLIRNGVPSAGPLPEKTLPDQWTVGTVALMRPCKGIEVLVKAMDHLRKRQRPVRMRVVGRFATTRYETHVLSLVQSQNLGDSIEFVGFTHDVPAELRQLDLFVLPSLGPEGSPMVVLEAMAHGLPVISSDFAGISDLVRDQIEGRFCATGDDRQLADVIDDFLLRKCDWQQMRRRAHRRHKQFTAERMAQQTADVYRSFENGATRSAK